LPLVFDFEARHLLVGLLRPEDGKQVISFVDKSQTICEGRFRQSAFVRQRSESLSVADMPHWVDEQASRREARLTANYYQLIQMLMTCSALSVGRFAISPETVVTDGEFCAPRLWWRIRGFWVIRGNRFHI
jgi:hypothetical protein